MKRTFFMTGLIALVLAFFMAGCNSMKKLQKEVIETAVVGYVNPVSYTHLRAHETS